MTNEVDRGQREYFFEGMRVAVIGAMEDHQHSLIPPYSYSVGDQQYLMRVASWMMRQGRGSEQVGLRDCMEYYLVENGHGGFKVVTETDEVDGGNLYYVARKDVGNVQRPHPDPDLVEAIIVDGRKMRHLYGEILMSGIEKRVKGHLTDCTDCGKIPSEVVKDY